LLFAALKSIITIQGSPYLLLKKENNMSEKTKHTLFSFVTTRAPQLLTDEQKETYYINYAAASGYFDSLLTGPADPVIHAALIKSLSAAFEPQALKDKSQLINLTGGDFSSFAAAYTAKDISGFAEGEITPPPHGGGGEARGIRRFPDPLDSQIVTALWDNLFYQLLTGNYSLQEQLQQAIEANNYLGMLHNVEDTTILLNARVVVPQALFGAVPSGENAAETPLVNPAPLLQSIAKLQAKEEIEQYKLVADTLQKAKAKYNAENDAAFLTARAAYEKSVNDFWKQMKQQEEGTPVGGQEQAPSEPEGPLPPPLELTDVPPFIFTPLHTPFWNNGIYSIFNEESEKYARQLNLEEATGFDDAEAIIKETVENRTAMIFHGLTFTNDVTVISGQILSAANYVADTVLYSYVIQLVPTGAGTYKILMAINTGNSNTVVNNVSYGSSVSFTAFTQQSIGNTVVLTLFPNGDFIPQTDNFGFSGTVTLQNGLKLSFKTGVSILKGSSGVLVSYGTPSSENPEAPSGYGIKRVGIADYRKVEQEVCCYDQGEVSHIENIMAREYKERSTRRLRRSEDTTTTESSTETENLTDSTSTDRFEMQQQTAKALSESTSTGVNASVSYGSARFGISSSLSGAYASNTSQQESNSQAVQFSKDITQQASEKIVTKVREERIIKIIDEFEEQNKHGFDNREGDKHISGVYRWIDKIYKNQIFNYGKRLMYEFMIPQPAVFHNEAMKTMIEAPAAVKLQKPVDPRVGDGVVRIKDHTEVTESNYKYWAAVYNAAVNAKPESTIAVGKSIEHYAKDVDQGESKTGIISVPDGYVAQKANAYFTGMPAGGGGWSRIILASIGDQAALAAPAGAQNFNGYFFDIKPFTKEVPVAVSFCNYHVGVVNFTVLCNLTNEAYAEWQLETFNTIIKAYEAKLAVYNDSSGTAIEAVKGTNPGFYRTIENTVLRKCCITYLTSQQKMGQKQYTEGGVTTTRPNNDAAMESYAALVKFIEQAFEWEILSYTFYPFYWANKDDWQAAYQQDNDDAIFRAFLQSGMARTMVSVRPGFEEAVMYYMATGKVWNGGKVPVIGDDLYLSIVEELKHPEYYVEETWETRVPTTLTLIQEGGIAAEADGLPCECGDENGIIKSVDTLKGLSSGIAS
jgi:hypothetical protein